MNHYLKIILSDLLLLLFLSDESLPRNPNRKTKTFSEILNEKARSGGRIGYNLDRYIDPELEDEFNLLTVNG